MLWTNRTLGMLLPPPNTTPSHQCKSICCHLRSLLCIPRVPKKRVSSPLIPPEVNCIKPTRDLVLHLGAVTLPGPQSLFLPIQSLCIQGAFKGLVDSGSSGCFVDPNFVVSNGLTYWTIALFSMVLINGTVNAYVTHAVLFPIDFACDYLCVPEFFITKLKDIYPVVLRHNWLVKHNPNIDWKTGTLQFPALKNHDTTLSTEALPRDTPETIQEQSLELPNPQKSSITLVNTTIFLRAVTNFIRSYLRQFFDDSHGLKASLKPLRRPFDRCQSRLEAIRPRY